MGKIFNTLLFIILAYLLPLSLRPELLLHYKIMILIGVALAVFLSQPGFHLKEAQEEHKRDQNSVLIILLLSLFSAAAPVIEWAYWHPEQHSKLALGIGLVLILSGIGLRIWAIRQLGAFFTATVQIKEEHQLVREGPYRLVRHPSYLGAFMAALGCAVLLQAWMGLFIATALMLIAYHIRIKVEEEALVKAFGSQYTDFQQQTKKLIPFVW